MLRKPVGASTRKRKVLFAAVGITVMLLSFVELWVMTALLGMTAWLAYAIQTVISVELNFIGNWLITYGDRRNENSIWRSLLLFHLSRSISIPFNQALFMLQVHWLPMWQWVAILNMSWINEVFGSGVLLANAVCIAATTILNWLLGDKFVFGGEWVKKAVAPGLQ